MTTDIQPAGSRPGRGSGSGYDSVTFARLEADARAIIARYPQARSALLPMLHLVQAEDGFVSRDGIGFCAQMLSITPAEVSAVATFYTQYKRRPNGKYTVGVCTNTLCAIMGGDEIFDELSDHLGVGHDETTEDGAITLERVECNAACDYAPVVMVNWEFFDNQTPASATTIVDDLRLGKDVAPTRGSLSVCDFKAMSRVLAGFTDGRADEGVGAGAPTVAGTVLAREQGWVAPGTKQPSQADAATEDTSGGATSDAATGDASGAQPTDSAPAAGAEQSSAERPPVGPADTTPEAQR